MFNDTTREVKAHFETVISTRNDEVKKRISGLLSGCSKETCIKEESVAVRV